MTRRRRQYDPMPTTVPVVIEGPLEVFVLLDILTQEREDYRRLWWIACTLAILLIYFISRAIWNTQSIY